jgi:ribosomal protein L14E/L6E/L27E
MDIREYAKKVQHVRKLQMAFFKNRTASSGERAKAVEEAKKFERELDQITSDLISGKQLEQKTMFQ